MAVEIFSSSSMTRSASLRSAFGSSPSVSTLALLAADLVDIGASGCVGAKLAVGEIAVGAADTTPTTQNYNRISRLNSSIKFLILACAPIGRWAQTHSDRSARIGILHVCPRAFDYLLLCFCAGFCGGGACFCCRRSSTRAVKP